MSERYEAGDRRHRGSSNRPRRSPPGCSCSPSPRSASSARSASISVSWPSSAPAWCREPSRCWSRFAAWLLVALGAVRRRAAARAMVVRGLVFVLGGVVAFGLTHPRFRPRTDARAGPRPGRRRATGGDAGLARRPRYPAAGGRGARRRPHRALRRPVPLRIAAADPGRAVAASVTERGPRDARPLRQSRPRLPHRLEGGVDAGVRRRLGAAADQSRSCASSAA